MALRAGYYGLKHSLISKLQSLATAKIIKTIGTGLNLTSGGTLNVKAASASALGGVKVGEGLEINDGVLNVTSTGGLDYSLTKQDTGLKWLDGRAIYKQTFQGTCSAVDTDITITDCDFIINYEGFLHQKLKNSSEEWNLPIPFVAMAGGGGSINQNQCVSIDVYYHKFTIRTGSQRLADSDPLTYTVTLYFVETAPTPSE